MKPANECTETAVLVVLMGEKFLMLVDDDKRPINIAVPMKPMQPPILALRNALKDAGWNPALLTDVVPGLITQTTNPKHYYHGYVVRVSAKDIPHTEFNGKRLMTVSIATLDESRLHGMLAVQNAGNVAWRW